MEIYPTNQSVTEGINAVERRKKSPGNRDFATQLHATIKDYGKKTASVKPHAVSMGTVTAEQPTVSHLLTGHVVYGHECWQIIHSNQNSEKPYTRIPEGTEIFLDPVTKELSWNTVHQKDFPPSASRQARQLEGHALREDLPVDELSSAHEQERIQQAVNMAATRHDLPSDLIFSVIRAESNFNVQAVSKAGAQGLMQLMPETARELGVEKPFDIFENVDAGARYLKKMLRLFGNNLEKALAAYNAGPGTVRRYNGQVPFAETRQYVARVMSYLEQKSG